MEDYLVGIIFIGLASVLWVVFWVIKTISNARKYLELKPKLDNVERSIIDHKKAVDKDRTEWIKRVNRWNSKIEKDKNSLYIQSQLERVNILKEKAEIAALERESNREIEKIAKQKSMGFPWMAEIYADYFAIKDGKLAEYLRTKKHPAYTAAENVRIIKNEKKELLKENKILSYKINYFIKLFPWLTDLIAENEDEDIPVSILDDDLDSENKDDKIKKYLTSEEYNKLPSIERSQKALDRYVESRIKSKWAIGRDYEMYVGYVYEQKGYKIEYTGIIDGFDDLGRDVIAIKGDEVCIIQCKRWAQWKEMREKHIFQLFGTTMEYWIKNFCNNTTLKTFEEFARFLNENKIRPIFFTSTGLSDRATEMANTLSVEVVENEPLGEFPRIKCNVNYKDGIKTKIYHLPMDQQYDRVIIEKNKGEFYAFTVKEAEDAGFRRAFRHKF